jgi:hypothetical protein
MYLKILKNWMWICCLGTVVLVCCLPAISSAQVLPWTDLGSLPTNCEGRTMLAVGDYVYAMQGDYANQGYLGTFYSQFQPNGTLGAWQSTSNRTLDRYAYSTASWGGYVYLLGGQTSPNNDTATVEFAKINGNGTLGNWGTTTSLPLANTKPAVAAYNGYLYAMGGENHNSGGFKSVQYAPINSDGTVGAWQTGPDLNVAHPQAGSIVKDGYLYVFGGGLHSYLTNTVERAKINPDGSLGSWAYDTSMPQNRGWMGAAVVDDKVYLAGGFTDSLGTTPLSSVIYSNLDTSLDPNNTLSSWQSTQSLNHDYYFASGFSWNGHLYSTGYYAGGGLTGTVEMSTVYYSTIASGNWSVASTWDNGVLVPDQTHAALVNSHSITVSTNGNAYRLLINNLGKVAIANNSILTVTDRLQIEPGGVLAGNGMVVMGTGIDNRGEIRVEKTESMVFSGGGATDNKNGGRIDVIQGGIEFTNGLTNQVAGSIFARDAILRFGTGLTNGGTLGVSFGTMDVFGPIDNDATGKIILSGNSNTTFWDDVANGGSIKVSAGSTAVFFGTLSGSVASGTGTVLIEGGTGTAAASMLLMGNDGGATSTPLDIQNDSATGLIISGVQTLGVIEGVGNTSVVVGGSLTATSIHQSTLAIGSPAAASIPEPSMIVLLALGVLPLIYFPLRRR